VGLVAGPILNLSTVFGRFFVKFGIFLKTKLNGSIFSKRRDLRPSIGPDVIIENLNLEDVEEVESRLMPTSDSD
jgi:hypothetical protein